MIMCLQFVLLFGFLSGYARTECPGIKWVNVNQLTNESQAFVSAKEGNLNLYHCRVTHEGNIVAGKGALDFVFKSCWIPSDGKEVQYYDFEILTNPNGAILRYVNASSGQPIPANALEVGRLSNGNIIHMSRAIVYNSPALGKVDNGYAYVPHFLIEMPVQNYEILTCLSSLDEDEHEMRIVNKCNFTIQVGVSGDNFTPENGGFELNGGERKSLFVPRGWSSGRIWGKTNCGADNSCETGECGTLKHERGTQTCTPDVTLALFDLDRFDDDYYYVSIVDAFNLQMAIEPIPGTFQTSQSTPGKYDCQAAICSHDIREDCPDELKKIVNGKTVACLSACTKYGSHHYCCPIGSPYGTAQTCRASSYANHFKKLCPLAYTYMFDDEESTFTCRSTPNKLTGYVTTFCP